MSIHHEVSIHCDECGRWMYANGQTTAQRTKQGWVSYEERGHRRHTCPACAGTSSRYWG